MFDHAKSVYIKNKSNSINDHFRKVFYQLLGHLIGEAIDGDTIKQRQMDDYIGQYERMTGVKVGSEEFHRRTNLTAEALYRLNAT